MSSHLRNREDHKAGPADLSIFPLDQDAIQRLARVLNSDDLKATRLKTANTILSILEPVFNDIDRMEALASKLTPARPDLIDDLRTMREDAENLRWVVTECVGRH